LSALEQPASPAAPAIPVTPRKPRLLIVMRHCEPAW
jgi:hypothetical protein